MAVCLMFCFVGTVHGRSPRTVARSAGPAPANVTHGVTEIRLVDMGEVDHDAITNPIVFVTRTGVRYHRGGCRYLRLSCSPLRLAEARALDYTPCLWCCPSE